jgi:tripartite-type tricarboxylate transporter receptor subunit TctC
LRRRELVLAAGLACASVPALAQTTPSFPARPVRLVVPFPAGGGTDNMARALADSLSKMWGQTVVVDNKAGAGTVVGNDFVSKSVPDGLTLLLNTSAVAIVPGLNPRLPYPAETGLSAVTTLGHAPNVAVVRPDSPIRSASDFLAQVRAKPGRFTYGSAGNGTSTHLAAELLKTTAKVFMVHVPYRGATPAMTDLMGGQIDVVFTSLPSVAGSLKSGKLRAIAVTSAKRAAAFDQIPTIAEAGFAGFDVNPWFGLLAPARTPEPVVAKINADVNALLKSKEVVESFAAQGAEPYLTSPGEFTKVLRSDIQKWGRVVKESGASLD